MFKKFWSGFIRPFGNNWSETLHYIAIFATFIWGMYTFGALLERDRAVQELDNAQNELVKKKSEISEIQKRLDGNFSSDIDIDVKVVNIPQSGFGLIIDVKVKNVGSKDVVLDIGESPLDVYFLKYSGDKLMSGDFYSPKYYRQLSSDSKISNVNFTRQQVLVGATKKISFFVEVQEPGVYYVTFEADPTGEQKDRLTKDGFKNVWFASEYVPVGI